MFKISGNKEFVQWWEHWMSRLHANRPERQARPEAEIELNQKGSDGGPKQPNRAFIKGFARSPQVKEF
jgi:hypothetical protein